MRFFKKRRAAGKYHKWFAWYPVWAWDEESLGVVWWELVERRMNSSEAIASRTYRVLPATKES